MNIKIKAYACAFVAFCAIAFFVSGCRKQKQMTVAGQWRCSGYGVDHYYYDTMVRVWTAADSQWMNTYSFADSNIVLTDRVIEIKDCPPYRMVITSLANDGPWTYLQTDTLSLVEVQGSRSQYITDHRLPSNEKYTIELLFDAAKDKIHVEYDWTAEGPQYHDIGGKITLDGVRH